MPLPHENDKNPGEPVCLPAILDATTGREVREMLTEWLDQASPSPLSGEKVERVTTPGVQLLLALEVSLRGQEKELELLSPSSALLATMTTLGLGETLERWSKVS